MTSKDGGLDQDLQQALYRTANILMKQDTQGGTEPSYGGSRKELATSLSKLSKGTTRTSMYYFVNILCFVLSVNSEQQVAMTIILPKDKPAKVSFIPMYLQIFQSFILHKKTTFCFIFLKDL